MPGTREERVQARADLFDEVLGEAWSEEARRAAALARRRKGHGGSKAKPTFDDIEKYHEFDDGSGNYLRIGFDAQGRPISHEHDSADAERFPEAVLDAAKAKEKHDKAMLAHRAGKLRMTEVGVFKPKGTGR